MTNKEFIEAIAPLVQKHVKGYGYGVPSAIIAQACLESAYGTSGKAKYHNYFGMKYRAGRLTCNSGTFTDASKEQKSDGSYIDISTKWYKFDSMDKGVEGYFQFISISNYAEARKKTDPEAYLTALKAGGYATSINYVKNLMAVIEKWNLTQYDKKEEVKKTVTKVSKPTIKTNLTTRNYTKMSGKKNKYIVIHYTGSTGSALNNTKYFKSTYRGASANYFVDPNDIYCCVKPSNMAWHCGDKAYSGTKHPYYGKCTNGNSIGIEMCCEKVLGKLHINSKTITNTAKLVKWLMQEYDIPASRVIRHHDVSGKSCPNANGLLKDATWKKFHKKITGTTSSTSTTKTATTTKKIYYTETGKYQVIKTPRVIRDTPKTTGKINGYIKDEGIYTITKVEGATVKYGKLKSGAGYICLRSDYVKKV